MIIGEEVFPYVSDAEDKLSPGVQRVLFFAALHSEDVNLAMVAARGNVFRVRGEGHRPRVD